MRVTPDYPPIWLAGFVTMAWAVGRVAPHGPDWLRAPGWVLITLAMVLMAAAAWVMLRHRTTVDPHGQPATLVTTGPFSISRNPIYLGDALLLAGLCLLFRAPLALLLVPVFVTVITRRFIAREEALLAAAFPAEFATYRTRTRRWI